jgi:TatA/E family protein of Tat protein translocase
MRYRLVMPFLREPSHILILLIVVVVLFGAKRLPDSARSLGRSLRIFKSEMKDMKEDGKDKKDGTDGSAAQ